MLRLACLALLAFSAFAQSPSTSLARHDFVYSGESHRRQIFIVRHGEIAWSYEDVTGKGEISDCVRLSNGNILYAHQFGVTLISPEKKVLWNYDTPPAHEVHTAVPIGTDRILYVQNGDPALVRVVNLKSGQIEREFNLPTKQPASVHGQIRHARLTPQGTLLVAHMELNKVVEYDVNGHELWSFPAAGAWGVEPLASGNVLITDRLGVREVTRRGDTVWSFKPSETPEFHFVSLQNAWRLPDGNTVVNSWSNEWTKDDANRPGQMQALELTPARQVVWVLQSWAPPADLGPATTIQFLDENSVPEQVHFGDIH